MKPLALIALMMALSFSAARAAPSEGQYEGIFTVEDEGGRFVPCGEREAWRLEPSAGIQAKFDAAIAKVVKAFHEGMGASPEDAMLPYFYLSVAAEVSATGGDRRYSKRAIATALIGVREATGEDFDRCGA